ncbi:NIL domain-containing protein [Pseudanabaena sp. ABRG5-3]|uniref:NIL domain-containing protein n=1 Tax=Pseudanabaena sp. ABRG5-3 TaxID=685565 RepID=UPI000DC6F8CF|nr:NIL domain-containing protein [Pseudanabaena sp. ABRG5-3]BBC26919.1 NIL domain-containing protein [Pseudanabaena sp. ABRG5-3]
MTVDTRSITKDIKVRIPEDLHGEPVISNLISQHGVTVNIVSATLGINAGSGWFHLSLKGAYAQIQTAIAYLNDLDIEIWEDNSEENTSL